MSDPDTQLVPGPTVLQCRYLTEKPGIYANIGNAQFTFKNQIERLDEDWYVLTVTLSKRS